ncbi:MAG: hypothetical protein AAGA96_18535 [Verrucomicrobiota bacterium]
MEIESSLKRLRLPERFGAIHVRRGDKVGENLAWTSETGHHEGLRVEVSEYLGAVSEKLDLFLLTDDFQTVEEARKILASQGGHRRLFTLATGARTGHSTLERIAEERFFSEEEVMTLLTECEVARRAEVFVGTMSSNLSRYVALLRGDLASCASLDADWEAV